MRYTASVSLGCDTVKEAAVRGVSLRAASGRDHNRHMARALTYAEAVAALTGALRFGTNPSLDKIRALCELLGHPERACRWVQVTGTNGKTSVTRMTAAVLSAHGVRTAAYTSPHLAEYRERIEVGGEPVSEADFARAVSAALDADAALDGEPATEFELLTAAGLWLMRDLGVEWGVLEVGMGGRWDATSVVEPQVAVITGVALDHMRHLGGTVEEIAEDKAQIIKPGSLAVLGPGTDAADAVLAARAGEVGAPIVRVREDGGLVAWDVVAVPDRPGGPTRLDVLSPLAGYTGIELTAPSYQAPNAGVALAACEAALGRALDRGAVRAAFASLRFPGRFELLRESPQLVIDGAHNPEAALVLAVAIAEAWPDPQRRPAVLLGVLDDKDAEGIVRALAPVVTAFVCTRSASSRALPSADLAAVVERVTGTPPKADDDLRAALALAEDIGGGAGVVATGSLTVAGEVRALFC
ncbi:MAG: dihydrofolate synthase [Coriobacteriaceae bacterium]|nr:dihydrofolate synthase [Coriobacteriaceae bacterium]